MRDEEKTVCAPLHPSSLIPFFRSEAIMITEQLSQALSIAAAELDPVSQAAATVTSGGVDMSKFERVMFVVMVGAVTTGTVDAKLQESATSGGTYTDISGASITQITTSNKIATLEIKATQLSAGK